MITAALLLTLAAEPITAGRYTELLGWSKDGRYLVCTRQATRYSTLVEYYLEVKGERFAVGNPRSLPPALRAKLQSYSEPAGDFPAPSAPVEHIVTARVYDTVDQRWLSWLIEAEELVYQGGTQLAAEEGGKVEKAQWEKWKQEHGVVGKESREGPGGVKADVKVEGANDVRWMGEVAAFRSVAEKTPKLSVLAGKHSEEIPLEAYGFESSYEVSFWWDAAGKRVAVRLERETQSIRDMTDGDVTLYIYDWGK